MSSGGVCDPRYVSLGAAALRKEKRCIVIIEKNYSCLYVEEIYYIIPFLKNVL